MRTLRRVPNCPKTVQNRGSTVIVIVRLKKLIQMYTDKFEVHTTVLQILVPRNSMIATSLLYTLCREYGSCLHCAHEISQISGGYTIVILVFLISDVLTMSAMWEVLLKEQKCISPMCSQATGADGTGRNSQLSPCSTSSTPHTHHRRT